jgi:hypothetical protein
MSRIDYDEDDVYYCNTCLSLAIINSSGTDEDYDDDPLPCYCGDCNSADVERAANIHEYLELKEQRKRK